MARDCSALALLAVLALSGCSGGANTDVAEAAAAAPVPHRRPAGARAGVIRTASAVPSAPGDSLQRANEIEVMRETFAYQGGTRDPFNSLITGVSVGPELADLQLVGIYQDIATPSNTVVVLREKVGGKRYRMRVGDRLARLRLVQIRSREVVFAMKDLGVERQETLSLRKQEDVTP